MRQKTFVSSIVANSTDTTWSQAWSALNFYIVIGLAKKPDSDKNIASYGKNILEKLQREYFSYEKKDLANIKQAVQSIIDGVDPDIEYSIVAGALVGNVFYIVCANEGIVVVKRGNKSGIVAQGENGKVIAFSGLLEEKDIVIVQTQEFARKIPPKKLALLFDGLLAHEISENLATIVHGGSHGTEAGLVIEYKNNKEEEEDSLEKKEKEPEIMPTREAFSLSQFIGKARTKANIFAFLFRKKALILGAVVALGILLVAGIFWEKAKQAEKRKDALLEKILAPSQKQYDDGIALINLNKNLAIESFTSVIRELEKDKDKLPEKSTQRKRVEDLIGKAKEKITSLESTATLENLKTVFSTDKSEDIREISSITSKDKQLVIVDKTTGAIAIDPKEDGTPTAIVPTSAKNAISVTADEAYIYLLSESSILRIDKKSKKSQKAIDLSNASDIAGFDTFLGNIYLLNSASKDIEKYPSPNFGKAKYFETETPLTSKPISMTIDGSIYVFDETGKIKKFTRGRKDDFTIKGLVKEIGKNSTIYTEAALANLYILDKDNKKIIVLSKTGDLQNQLDIKDVQNPISVSADEASKKIYISNPTTVYSLDT